MKCTLDFPVSIGQVLYYANHKRNCVDKVTVVFVSITRLGMLIGLEDEDGDLIKTKHEEDVGTTLFNTEEEANCAILAGGNEK